LIRVIYSSEAKADLRRERDYYAAINPELGARFTSAVEQAALSLAAQPQAMQVIRDYVRRWPSRVSSTGFCTGPKGIASSCWRFFIPSNIPPAGWGG
jgi:plasmid stabilization system protein ParE